MARIKNFNQYNESVAGAVAAAGLAAAGISLFGGKTAEAFGKLLGKIQTGAKHLKTIIGRTGKDEDLAEQVLNYLKNLPTDYVASTAFNYGRVYNPMPASFVFFGKVFPLDSQTNYRVDVINLSDMKLEMHGKPYRIIISKLTKTPTGFVPFGKYKGGIGANDPGVPSQMPNLLITANPKADEEMCQLDCSLQIARKIYNKCQEIWDKTNPNTKGSARGDQNTTTRQGRGSGAIDPKTGKSKNRKFKSTWTW